MQSIEALYDRYPEQDIYILGTGASVRVFPLDMLQGRTVIGLNMAWKLWPVNYGITMRPELNIPEFMGEGECPQIQWITKPNKLTSPEQVEFVARNSDRFFSFRTDGKKCNLPKDQPSEAGRMLEWVRQPTGEFLYLWSSISQSAMNLAANMGARNIFLIGCDNSALGGNHHAHAQHTFWKGEDPNVRYRQYEQGCHEVRLALRERGVNVVSLTPFMSLSDADRQFTGLCDELGKPRYIENPDITQQQSSVSVKSSAKAKLIAPADFKKSKRQGLLASVQNYFSRAS
jgi:hypothetical protein